MQVPQNMLIGFSSIKGAKMQDPLKLEYWLVFEVGIEPRRSKQFDCAEQCVRCAKYLRLQINLIKPQGHLIQPSDNYTECRRQDYSQSIARGAYVICLLEV